MVQMPAGAPALEEILLDTAKMPWREKSLKGISEKMLWRNEETGATRAVIPVGLCPAGLAFTPDGTRAYVANQAGGSLTPITVAGGTAGAAITIGGAPTAVAITPDGARGPRRAARPRGDAGRITGRGRKPGGRRAHGDRRRDRDECGVRRRHRRDRSRDHAGPGAGRVVHDDDRGDR